jgi:hypothetical protein
MPRLHALELVLDDEGQDAVRRDWEALHRAGLPSMLDHRSASNAPHVTVVSATELTTAVEDGAAALLGPHLPVPVRASGVLLLGGSRVTVARSLDVADAVVAAVLELRRAVDGPQHAGWLPHLTLARRVPRAEVGRAVALLGHEDRVLSCVELRRWDPEAGTVRTLVRG